MSVHYTVFSPVNQRAKGVAYVFFLARLFGVQNKTGVGEGLIIGSRWKAGDVVVSLAGAIDNSIAYIGSWRLATAQYKRRGGGAKLVASVSSRSLKNRIVVIKRRIKILS